MTPELFLQLFIAGQLALLFSLHHGGISKVGIVAGVRSNSCGGQCAEANAERMHRGRKGAATG